MFFYGNTDVFFCDGIGSPIEKSKPFQFWCFNLDAFSTFFLLLSVKLLKMVIVVVVAVIVMVEIVLVVAVM